MDLLFFNWVSDSISSNKHLKKFKWKIVLYRYFDGHWYLGNSETTESAPSLLSRLNLTRKSKGLKRFGVDNFVYSESIDTVINFETPIRTRGDKVNEYVNSIRECVEHAEHAFDATHDILTGLLNRAGAEKEIFKLLGQPSTLLEEERRETLSPSPTFGLITLDIDHFKQVNDSYGHAYGDAVLKAFAWRLQDVIKVHQGELNQLFVLSRPGGEEFEVFISDVTDKETFRLLAESIRASISREPIPTDDQLGVISRELELEVNSCPKVHGRHITASLGCASGKLDGKNLKKFYFELKGKADSAVYRAKADGRDRVRFFNEIKQSHGKVLEHVEKTNLVVVDIGSEVGVREADVFEVFHPQFSGDRAYQTNDGRSVKELGQYPRLSVGQIVAINVQSNLSFCHVLRNETSTAFPQGSNLEFFPVGLDRPYYDWAPYAIPGYVSRFSDFFSSLEVALARRSVYCIASALIEPSLPDVTPTQKEKYFAESLTFMKVVLPPGVTFGYLRPGVIGFYSTHGSGKNVVTKAHLERISKTIFDGYKLCIGGLLSEEGPESEGALSDKETLDVCTFFPSPDFVTANDLIHMMRICSYIARYSPRSEGLALYHESFISQFMWLVRDLGISLREALYEYHRLIGMGYGSATFHNHMGLIIFQSDDSELLSVAESILGKAVDLDKDDDVFPLNLAICRTRLGKHQEAFAIYRKHERYLINDESHPLYLLSYAKTVLEMIKSRKAKIANSKLNRIYSRALEHRFYGTRMQVEWLQEIKEASMRLEKVM